MARKPGFYVAALLVYVLAWFLPVINGGTSLTQGGLPGWEALIVALGPIGDWNDSEGVLRPVLSVLSGLSNGLFLVALVLLVRRPPRGGARLARALAAASVLNLYWQGEVGFKSELRIGYYLWVASFILLAVHAFALARDRARAGAGDRAGEPAPQA